MTIETTTPLASNGRPLETSDPYAEAAAASALALEQQATALRALVAGEHELVERLEGLLHEAKTRERRVQRALDVLTGETAPQGRLKSKPGPKGALGENMRRAGRESAERIFAVLREADEPIGVSDLERITGLAGSTVQRALERLREEDRVRATGKRPGGVGVLYAPMPDAQAQPIDDAPSGSSSGQALSDDERERRERIVVQYGREHDEFRAADLVEPLGLTSANRLGPMLRGYMSKGLVEQTRTELNGEHRTPVAIYRLTESARGS